MVLAQQKSLQTHPLQGYVSIPLWFSLNMKNFLSLLSIVNVSIPLWFSLNRVRGRKPLILERRFHPTMVLAQPKKTPPNIFACTCFHPTMVLAQPFRYMYMMATYWCFHPTMVLAQRSQGERPDSGCYRFHPTMVLAQRTFPVRLNEAFALFPSHYGSRSTAFITKNYTGLQGVKSNRS